MPARDVSAQQWLEHRTAEQHVAPRDGDDRRQDAAKVRREDLGREAAGREGVGTVWHQL